MTLSPLAAGDPSRVGPYELRGRLGAGGMGVVFLGFDTDGTALAIKVLPSGAGPDLRRRLRREAELLEAVRHDRVARFVAADVATQAPWIAMHYVPGPSLADAPVPLGSVPLREMAIGLADAITVLHQSGLVHRDVKPGNVILTFAGPVLVDFGIAVGPDVTSFTSTGTVVGTPAWMAPEQLAGGDVGPPADVWGWAATCAYAATGRPPFGSGSLTSLAIRIQSDSPDLSGVPDWLTSPLTLALSKDPAERPSAAELSSASADRTVAIVRGPSAGTVRLGQSTSPKVLAPTAEMRRPNRRFGWKLVGLVGAVAAIGLVVAFTLHDGGSRSAGGSSTSATNSSGLSPTTTPPPSTAAPASASTPKSVISVSPTIDAATLVTLGVCPTVSECAITGQVPMTHPVWGNLTMVTALPAGTNPGTGHVVAIDTNASKVWDVALPNLFTLAPAPTPIDSTGHLFLNYNPGRYNGVIVLASIGTGFDDFASLPTDGNQGRFYDATASDTNNDGALEIDQSLNNCVPNCAAGQQVHTIYRWTGTTYASG